MTKTSNVLYPSDDWGPLGNDPWGLLNIPADSDAWRTAAEEIRRFREIEGRIGRSGIEPVATTPDRRVS